MADPDFELRRGPGSTLLAQPEFLPSVISSFFPKIGGGGGGPSPRSAIGNLCQSSPSLTILVPLWFIIISLVFSYLSKLLFSGLLWFKGNFVNGQNNSKYCVVAPLSIESLDEFFTHSTVPSTPHQAFIQNFVRSRSGTNMGPKAPSQ